MKEKIIQSIRPLIFIVGIFTLNIFLWLNRLSSSYLQTDIVLTALYGSTLLMGFMMVFLLSTRMPILVKWFGGIEHVYFWHRVLAIGTVGFIFIHQTFATDHGLIVLQRYLTLGIELEELGELSRNVFILLVGVALFAKLFKYEHFRFAHRFMIVPYAFGLYHGFALSWVDLFSFDYLSIWMISTSLIGIASSLYMLFFYKHIAIRHQGIIVEKTKLNASTLELKVKMNHAYRMKPGQFAFIKIHAPSIDRHPHPFSISGYQDGYIYLTIKTLGDYTKKLYDVLETPAVIALSNAFGHMTFTSKKPQIWIAGGVGITPFIGKIRSASDVLVPTTLYYSVRRKDEAVHVPMLEAYAAQNPLFRFHLIEQQTMGYLSAEMIEFYDESKVYMCGPKPMVDSLRKQIKAIHPKISITFEAFSFTGNLMDKPIMMIKKILKKYKLSTK